MRWIALVMALAACSDGGTTACTYNGHGYKVGEVFPAGDGCNACTCGDQGVSCTKQACRDAGTDADPNSCAASGGCPSGVACGLVCCGAGERCTGGACECGTGSACTDGNTCQAGGPLGSNSCGVTCCGATRVCPG